MHQLAFAYVTQLVLAYVSLPVKVAFKSMSVKSLVHCKLLEPKLLKIMILMLLFAWCIISSEHILVLQAELTKSYLTAC